MSPEKTTRRRMGKSFSSRNTTVIGALGLVVIAALLYASFNASALPIIGGGTTYTAAFSEAAGLTADNEVRIAGVRVGEVTGVTLEGDHVKVAFRVKNAFVGDQSHYDIKIKTLLGAKFLAIDSVGSAEQPSKQEVPMSRTTSPFDVYPAFSQLSQTVESINTDQLAKSFEVLAAGFKNTPDSIKSVATGLSRLSNTISSRDDQLQTLLKSANGVTSVLAERDQNLTKLLSDGGALLDELNARRDEIHALLINTTLLSAQLQGLVSDNQATLNPALKQLDGVVTLLQNNQDSLDRGLALLAPFYRLFANTLGNGRWFDTYIQNLSLSGLLSGALSTVTGG